MFLRPVRLAFRQAVIVLFNEVKSPRSVNVSSVVGGCFNLGLSGAMQSCSRRFQVPAFARAFAGHENHDDSMT